MSTIEMTKEVFFAKREEFRKEIRELSFKQKEDKKLLRQPHSNIPKAMRRYEYVQGCFEVSGIQRAGYLMIDCRKRANKITELLIEYKKFLGKPFDMHLHNL